MAVGGERVMRIKATLRHMLGLWLLTDRSHLEMYERLDSVVLLVPGQVGGVSCLFAAPRKGDTRPGIRATQAPARAISEQTNPSTPEGNLQGLNNMHSRHCLDNARALLDSEVSPFPITEAA